MNRQTLLLLGAALFFAGVRTTQAQNSASAHSAAPASVQTTEQNPAPPAVQTPVKKIWTNEDLTALRDHPGVSTFQSAGNKPASPGARSGAAVTGKDAEWYRGQIAKLERQIPPLDEKIAQLRAALAGKTVNETRHYGGVRLDDWRVQLTQLQKRHDDIEAKITVLEDRARHDGIPPNALP